MFRSFPNLIFLISLLFLLSGCGAGLLTGQPGVISTNNAGDSSSTLTPTLTLGNIRAGATLYSGFVIGTVTNGILVQKVQASFDGGAWTDATGVATWKIAIPNVGSGTIWATDSSHTIKVRLVSYAATEIAASSTITIKKGINRDYNGDGYGDAAIGAPFPVSSGPGNGDVYIYYGSSTGLSSTPTTTISYPDSGTTPNFGLSTQSAGDTNGDGYADLVVGAAGENTNTGAMYVFHGSSSGLATTANKIVRIAGMGTGVYFAETALSAGDTNKDGYDDIAAGAWCSPLSGGSCRGEVYIFHGSSTGIPTTPSKVIPFPGGGNYKLFGRGLSSGGDLNADGYSDIVIGAHGSSGGGSAYIFLGSATGLSTTTASTLSNPVVDNSANFGRHVQIVGDLDNDGYNDFIVTSYTGLGGGTARGAIYLFKGAASFAVTSSPTQTINGSANSENFGAMVSDLGDTNGDGIPEFYVASTGTLTATIYTGTTTGINTTALKTYTHPSGTAASGFGYDSLFATDFNGDSYPDFLVGSYLDTASGGSGRGAAYLFLSTGSGGLSSNVATTFLNPGTVDNANFSRSKR